MGLTYGGDQIGSDVQYDNGTSAKIHGGALIDFRGGIEYRMPASPVSFQTSIGYHFDRAGASNGDVTFSRMPLELLAHYQALDTWRFGGGIRKSLNAEVKATGLGTQFAASQKYTGNTGLVLEAETFVTPQFGVKLRVVSEKFKPEFGNKEVDGSHFGAYGMYYFK